MINEEVVEKYLKAGSIASRVRREVESLIKPEVSLVKLAEVIEGRIRELGGQPAFPVNISINEVAAHYTPTPGDQFTIPDSSIVKIDIGVHVDGYVADTATTVTLNPAYEPLLESAEKALESALKVVGNGVPVNYVGKVIEDSIRMRGFKPIRNLTGHSMDRFMIHSGVSIPNYNDYRARYKLVDGVYAIEPFATNGEGLVKDTPTVAIYSLRGAPKARDELMKKLWETYRTLPFCLRWLSKTFESIDLAQRTLRELMTHGRIHAYPVLVEASRGLVSQYEHTVLINGREVIVTTI
ncbi:MAG: type II methionyl aminopeptidase [Sulfolobales archaeon]|nr:type II methionyl aminopeptidase [Sulfolobales archaeon]